MPCAISLGFTLSDSSRPPKRSPKRPGPLEGDLSDVDRTDRRVVRASGASVEKFVDYRVTMLAKLGSADQCVEPWRGFRDSGNRSMHRRLAGSTP